jgi:hypothetical protein
LLIASLRNDAAKPRGCTSVQSSIEDQKWKDLPKKAGLF